MVRRRDLLVRSRKAGLASRFRKLKRGPRAILDERPMQVAKSELTRSLGLFDSTMLVAGSMIGSGIFLVSAEMARNVGSPGWLLLSWVITGILTIAAALSYGELASM